jgi:hypothetical protein
VRTSAFMFYLSHAEGWTLTRLDLVLVWSWLSTCHAAAASRLLRLFMDFIRSRVTRAAFATSI